jgi:sigma-B regulation protein RsbU (phosphoserine phosphatase)
MAEVAEKTAQLAVTLGDGRTLRQALGNQPMVIGRDPACDLLIDDVGVSRHHSRISPQDDGYIIEDLGSKNGTQVNGRTVRTARLRDGDVVVCGTSRLVFRQSLDSSAGGSVVLTEPGSTDTQAKYTGRSADLNLPQRRLQILYDLSDRLTRLREPLELLDDAMDVCFEMFRFERGAIGVCPPGRRGVDWPVVRNAYGREGELTVSRTIVTRALEHGERAVVVDADLAQLDPTISMVTHGIRSALCVPLEYQDQILGVIYGDRVSSGMSYTDEDVDFLAGLARQVSIGLVNGRLAQEQKLKIQLENEIHLARDIQTRLFPATLPNRESVQVAALNEPGRQVSGDYYDVIELDRGRVGVLVADVTGKGVASSLLMANLQAAVRVTLDASRSLDDLLDQWNRLIYRNTSAGTFVTCVVAIVDPDARSATFASAGHPRPYLATADRARSYELTGEAGFPLGIIEQASYSTRTADLGPDPCTLFLYSDGVIEAMDAADDLFGWDRTADALHASTDLDPTAVIRRVRGAISVFVGNTPQSDDITMLAVHLP